MGSYTVIEDVGSAIVKLLQKNLVPEFVQHQEEIALCNIDDRGEFKVAVSLYNVQECREMNENGMRSQGISKQIKPSMYLELYYVISVSFNSDVKFRAKQEQTVLSRIIQILYDEGSSLRKYLEDPGDGKLRMTVEMSYLTLEEKMKIFNVPGKAYKPCLYYKICPVELISLKGKKVARITNFDQSVEEEER